MTSTVQVVGVAVGTIVFVVFLGFFTVKFCMKALSSNGYTDNLLENDSVGALNGLNRGDIQDRESESSKWPCNICAFANGRDTQACALCETKRGTTLATSPNDVGPAFVHPSALTALQHSASMRKEWRRTLDVATNTISWTRAATTVQPQDKHFFVVTSALESDANEEVLYPTDNECIQLIVNDCAAATTEVDQPKPLEFDSTTPASKEEVAGSSALRIELVFKPLDENSASRTLMGTTLPPWFVQHLHDLTSQPFATKYIALLSLLKANIDHGHIKLRIYRNRLYQESIRVLELIQPHLLCTKTRIELIGEAGVDAGGLQREWYTLFTQAAFEPSAGLFVATDSYGYTLNPASTSSSDLGKFRAVGRLLARSILDEQVLPFHFTVPLFKMILGTPLSITDMLYMDKQIYTSLKFVESTADVEGLCLDFSVALASGDVVELIPNGQSVMVTTANQAEYVQRMLQYLLFDRIRPQLQSLLTGLFEILPQHYLMMFDHKELELVLCGVTEIDVADWKQFTVTSSCLRDLEYHSMKTYWFWETLKKMSSHDRAKILQFATGSSRVPVQGFKGLTSSDGVLCPFSIKAVPYVRGALPQAHACFNRIDLPMYPTMELMEDALHQIAAMGSIEFTLK